MFQTQTLSVCCRSDTVYRKPDCVLCSGFVVVRRRCLCVAGLMWCTGHLPVFCVQVSLLSGVGLCVFRHGNSPWISYFQRKSDCMSEGKKKFRGKKKKNHFRADLIFRSACSEPAFCFTMFKIKCCPRMLYVLRNCAYR